MAQQSLELGLGMGISLYQGDITENYLQYNGHKRVYSAFFRYNMGPHISIKGTYTKGIMGASDIYSETRFDRGWSFSATVDEAVVAGQFFFLNQFVTNRKGESVFLFSPYLMIGVGYSKIDATFVDRFNPDQTLVPQGDKDLFFVLPFGGGIRGELSPSFKLGIEVGIRPTFSDFIDDVVTTTEVNDWYTFAGVNVSYVVFKERYKAYRKRRFKY
jgi:opacity protein-like surface antigen